MRPRDFHSSPSLSSILIDLGSFFSFRVSERFRDKTATEWNNHNNDFEAVSGKYTLLKMAVGEDDEEEEIVAKPMPAAKASSSASASNTATSSGLGGLTTTAFLSTAGVSMLDPCIQDFVQMIFD